MSSSLSSGAAEGATLLMSIPDTMVLRVQGGAVERLASGALQILQSAGGMVFLVLGSGFSYPLVHQPCLKSEDRVFILPAEAGTHFVLYISRDASTDVAARFERALATTTQLQARTNTAVVAPSAEEEAAFGDEELFGVDAGGAQAAVASTVITLHDGGAAAAPVAAAPAASPRTSASLLGHLPSLPRKAPTSAEVGAALSSALLFTGHVAAKVIVAGAGIAGKGVAATARAMRSALKAAPPGTHVRPETIARLEKAKVVSRMAVTVRCVGGEACVHARCLRGAPRRRAFAQCVCVGATPACMRAITHPLTHSTPQCWPRDGRCRHGQVPRRRPE